MPIPPQTILANAGGISTDFPKETSPASSLEFDSEGKLGLALAEPHTILANAEDTSGAPVETALHDSLSFTSQGELGLSPVSAGSLLANETTGSAIPRELPIGGQGAVLRALNGKPTWAPALTPVPFPVDISSLASYSGDTIFNTMTSANATAVAWASDINASLAVPWVHFTLNLYFRRPQDNVSPTQVGKFTWNPSAVVPAGYVADPTIGNGQPVAFGSCMISVNSFPDRVQSTATTVNLLTSPTRVLVEVNTLPDIGSSSQRIRVVAQGFLPLRQ